MLMKSGASRPFLAATDVGQEWVLKWLGNPQGPKSIFNELVAGRLATLMGLAWPAVGVVHISAGLLVQLESEGIRPTSELAVGVKYAEGLRPVPWPTGGYRSALQFPRRNAEHLLGLIPREISRRAFYGKMVFDNWLLLRDTKYDTLYLDPSGEPIFLDGSSAFGGSEWSLEDTEWSDTAIDIHSPYLEGVLTDHDCFEPWLKRLEHIAIPDLQDSFAGIPVEWGAPMNYVARLSELISRTPQSFVPMVRQWIEWRRVTGA